MKILYICITILDGKVTQGGTSRLTGGRDERPPQSSSPSATPANNGKRWVPPSSLKRATQKHDERTDAIFRKVRGILNKLTPEKFDKLGLELLNVGIDSQIVLRGIILLIFEKALDEPKYSSLYAQLCQRLCEDTPNFEPSTSGAVTFKRLLLTKCQDEFENRTKATAAYEKDGPLTDEEQEQYVLAKHKMLGNIKFIGELGKLEMVQARILHQCIKQLLAKKKRGTVADMAEDLECLCQIMKTVGHQLDHDQARLWMDQYFVRMSSYRANLELPSRIRFMLQDVAELRENGWVPRNSLRENGPKTIQQVHNEAARETGQMVTGHQRQNHMGGGMGGFPSGLDLFGRPMNGVPHHRPHGHMSDMFGPVPTSPPTMGGIGTGPGVIPMDQPFGSSYPRLRGRGGYQNQFGQGGHGNKLFNRGGSGGGGGGSYQPRNQEERSRTHDDSSDDEFERPGSGGSSGSNEGGRGGRGGGSYQRGGQNYYRGGRQTHKSNYQNDGYNRDPNYQPNNYNPNYQPRDRGDQGEESNRGFVSRGGRGANYTDRGRGGRGRGGHYDVGQQGGGFITDQQNSGNYNYNRQSYKKSSSNDGYSNQGYNSGGSGSQGYGGNQGYNDPGYGGNQGFSNQNQGFNNQQNFRQQQHNQHNQQAQKDIEKLPPRFRKQLEMQHKHPDSGQSGSPPSGGGRSSPQDGGQQQAGQGHDNTRASSKGGPSTDSRPPINNSNSSTWEQEPFLPFQSESVAATSRGSPLLDRGGSPGGSNSPPPPLNSSSNTAPNANTYNRSPSKMEEISLRPVRMPAAFRPNIPSMLPKSAQGPPPPPVLRNPNPQFEEMLQQPPPKPNPNGPVATSLTIKTVPAPEKSREKKKSMSQEELKVSTDKMLKEYLEGGYDLSTALKATKEMKPPRRFIPELVTFLILRSLDQSDTDRENVGKLITALREEGVFDSELFMEGFCAVLDQMKTLEADVPLVKSYVSKFAAYAVSTEVITLTDLSAPLENGRHYPLFLLCLQQTHKIQGKDWLVKVFNESRLDLQKMLPECDQSKERMLDILEDRGLSFMFPLLHVQSDLWKQINQNPNPTAIYKWIKDNCSTSLYKDPKFITIVFTNVIKYIVTQTTLGSDVCPDVEPEKSLIKKEKELAAKLKGVLAAYIHHSIQLQLVAIYAVQVFCHSHSFPKGLLLRLFMYMYDLEIIDEEAFLKWKEDINDQYPGKGKALFQVNQWLLWLEQADSESSDED